MSRRFLVLHGWESWRPREHWHWWLTEELRQRGEQVIYPQLPDPDAPTVDSWLRVLHAELAQLGSGERIVVAHSMSCQLWLMAAAGLTSDEGANRVLLVAPPDPNLLAQHSGVVDFAIAAPNPDSVRIASGELRMVCGSDDPWSPEGPPYADLGVPVDIIDGAGHVNPDSGYGPWPSVLRWCLDGTTPIGPRDPTDPR